jgi:hypothetical protein
MDLGDEVVGVECLANTGINFSDVLEKLFIGSDSRRICTDGSFWFGKLCDHNDSGLHIKYKHWSIDFRYVSMESTFYPETVSWRIVDEACATLFWLWRVMLSEG